MVLAFCISVEFRFCSYHCYLDTIIYIYIFFACLCDDVIGMVIVSAFHAYDVNAVPHDTGENIR